MKKSTLFSLVLCLLTAVTSQAQTSDGANPALTPEAFQKAISEAEDLYAKRSKIKLAAYIPAPGEKNLYHTKIMGISKSLLNEKRKSLGGGDIFYLDFLGNTLSLSGIGRIPQLNYFVRNGSVIIADKYDKVVWTIPWPVPSGMFRAHWHQYNPSPRFRLSEDVEMMCVREPGGNSFNDAQIDAKINRAMYFGLLNSLYLSANNEEGEKSYPVIPMVMMFRGNNTLYLINVAKPMREYFDHIEATYKIEDGEIYITPKNSDRTFLFGKIYSDGEVIDIIEKTDANPQSTNHFYGYMYRVVSVTGNNDTKKASTTKKSGRRKKSRR